jgi:cholesterol transport system auxiliary component
MFLRNSLILVASVALLAACGPIVSFGGDGPPPRQFNLAYSAAPNDAKALPGVLLVDELGATAELRGQRMAMRVSAQEVQYLNGAQWSDRPARLLRGLIEDAARQAPGAAVLGPSNIDLRIAFRLTGTVQRFDVVVDGPKRQAVIVLDAILANQRPSRLIASRRFEAKADAAADTPAAVAAALNMAANDLARDVAAWAGTQASGGASRG